MNGDNQNLTSKERWELRRRAKADERSKRASKKLMKRIVIWAFVAIGVSAAVFGIIKMADNSSPSGFLPNASVSDSDWLKGDKNAKVILIEYSDFQCPACGFYAPIVKRLINEFGDSIGFVYRHFPLKQIHHAAELAARAAEAAGKQNKFWEMHDVIFENQEEWSGRKNAEELFVEYAESLGIGVELFKNDIDSEGIKNKVENDYQSGFRAGVNSTPSFFLNGKKLKNPRSYDEFKNIISQALDENS